jgi:hypothetical protein
MTNNEKSTELMKLLTPHRSGNIMQRVQAFVVQKTGKKLTEYLGNGAAEEDKSALLNELIGICRDEQWDLLPSAAGGQQVAAGVSTSTLVTKAVAPAPKPIPVTIKPAVPAFVETKDDGEEVEEVAAAPAQVAVVDPITAALAALQSALTAAKTSPAPVPIGLSVEECRMIARREIASVFRTIAEVLEAQTK